MSLSVTQRPADYAAVGNPIVYKMSVTGGPFVNYRVAVDVKRSSDNSSITGTTFNYTPDASDELFIDVASLLKNALSLDTGGAKSIYYYLSYQEFYEGSSTSPIDDTGNKKVAVFGAMQIGQENDMEDYVIGATDSKFLTKFEKPSYLMGLSNINTVSFINPDYTYAILRTRKYDISGSLISTENSAISINQRSVNISQIGLALNDTVKMLVDLLFAYVAPDASTFSDGANPFSSKSGFVFTKTTPVSGTTYSASKTITTIPAGSLWSILAGQSVLALIGPGPIIGGSANIAYINSGTGHTIGLLQFNPTGMGFTSPVGTPSGTTSEDIDTIEISATVAFAASNVTILTLSMPILIAGGSTPLSEELEFKVKRPCDNPIYLEWKNTLGGASCWLFDYNQDYDFVYTDGKAPQKMLFTEGLTINEWEAINEVNTPGERYRVPIIELDGMNKTSKRTDQQLYVIDEDGNKTGVINVTSSQNTRTKRQKHRINVQIEYPEIFL